MQLRDFRLDKHVAIITGVGRGIGAGIAMAYAQAGADVILVARTRPQLDAVVARIRASGRTALTVAGDVRDLTRHRSSSSRPSPSWAGSTSWSTTPAVPSRGPRWTPPAPNSMRHSTSTSPRRSSWSSRRPRGCWKAPRQCGEHQLDQDRMVGRGLLVYGTVEAALSHMTRLLAADLAPRVRVNAVAPGVVETDGLKAPQPAAERRGRLSRSPRPN